MMCVNDAFAWPLSVRWLLMMRRFSSRTLTGMLRTDVAVGTDSDASMFCTIFDAAPRSGVALPSGAGTAVGRGAGDGVLCGAGNPAGAISGAVAVTIAGGIAGATL